MMGRESSNVRHGNIRHCRECLDRFRTPIHDAPVLGLAEIDCQMLEGLVVQSIGCCRKLCQSCHRVSNIRMTKHIGKEDLS